MRAKNKQAESEKFGRNKILVYATIAIMAILILTVIFLYPYPNQSIQPKAAIIDQLSSSQLTESSCFPNKTFIETAKEMLSKRFPKVDYYKDNATVERYRSLPSLGYKLIIWRVHSALDKNYFIAICSSEKYIPGKYNQYSADQLTLCNITGDPKLYFAITPKFVEECMSGRFEDTVIIFMSCNGLKHGYYETAETFVEKGVKVFISWDGWIDSSDNDHAITLLLDYLIGKNNTINEAVTKVPPSPFSPFHVSSRLKYYPDNSEVANYRIPNYKQSNIAGNAGLAVIAIFIRGRSKLKHAFQFRISSNQNVVKSIL
jgi:hypothetical protein